MFLSLCRQSLCTTTNDLFFMIYHLGEKWTTATTQDLTSTYNTKTRETSRTSLDKMSALPFFIPPPDANRRLPNSRYPYTFAFFLPQTFEGTPATIGFQGPLSWHEIDRVRLTIARNAILERIVDASDEARTLEILMARISQCFIRSFDVMFPGHGLVTYCQHRTVFSHDMTVSTMSSRDSR